MCGLWFVPEIHNAIYTNNNVQVALSGTIITVKDYPNHAFTSWEFPCTMILEYFSGNFFYTYQYNFKY